MKGHTAHCSPVPAIGRDSVRTMMPRVARLVPAFCARLAAAAIGLVGVPASTVCAADIAWHKNYADAWEQAGQQGKPLLVQISATWCGPCHRMFGETYVDQQITERIGQDFVAVVLDADSHPELVEAFKVEALPTTVIVTVNRRIARRLTGYQSADDLGNVLSQAAVAARSDTVRSAAGGGKAKAALSVTPVSRSVLDARESNDAPSRSAAAAPVPFDGPAVAERPTPDLLAGRLQKNSTP